MEKSKLHQFTKEELVEKLTRIYDQPYLQKTIYTLIDKIEEVNNTFKDVTIDVTNEEDRSFNNFVSWGEKVIRITDTIDALLERIDPDIRAEMRERMRTASDVSLEGMIKKARRQKTS